MGTAYNGLNGNVVIPASVAITSSTAANPTVIQTTAAHGLTTGDYVDILFHTTNTGANCINQPVTVVDATHFSVAIDTHTAAAGAGGGVYPRQFTGNVSLNPANGDSLSAATWIPGMSNASDRTTGLIARMPAWSLMYNDIVAAKTTDPLFTGAGGGYWFDFTSAVASYTPATLTGTPVIWSCMNVATTDKVEVDVSMTVLDLPVTSTVFSQFDIALYYQFVPMSGSPTIGSFSPVLGSEKAFLQAGATSPTTSQAMSFQLKGLLGPATGIGTPNPLTLTAPNTVGKLYLAPFICPNSANQRFTGVGNYMVNCKVWRPTGVLWS
jgi:hypothetical protein